MSEQNQITLAITAYNESQRNNFEWIREAISHAICHPLVRHIVIVNDGTPDGIDLYEQITGIQKVVFHQNPANLGVFGNKLTSIDRSTTDWVLMCDSDNVMDSEYFDRLAELRPWKTDMMYSASFAKPNFDYRHFVGTWDLRGIAIETEKPLWWCLVNTGNWFLHRPTFLEVFRSHRRSRFDLQQPNYFGLPQQVREGDYWRRVFDAQDSFFINKTWWLAGKRLCVVDRLEYDHRVDKGNSGFQGNYDRSPTEKEALAPIYMLEMQDRALTPRYDWHKLPEYRFEQNTGSRFFYSKTDGPWAAVDMKTGRKEIVVR